MGSVPDKVLFEHTDPKYWIYIDEKSRKSRPTIDPIPYHPRLGETEEFEVCLSPQELESIKDDFGDIRYEKLHEFLLPEIEGVKYCD